MKMKTLADVMKYCEDRTGTKIMGGGFAYIGVVAFAKKVLACKNQQEKPK